MLFSRRFELTQVAYYAIGHIRIMEKSGGGK